MIPQNQSLLDSPSILHRTLSNSAHIPNPTNPPIQRTTTRTHYPLTAPNLQNPSTPSQSWVTPSHYPANSSYCRVANGKSTYRTIRITSAHRPPVMFIFTINISWIRSAFCNSISQPHNRWRSTVWRIYRCKPFYRSYPNGASSFLFSSAVRLRYPRSLFLFDIWWASTVLLSFVMCSCGTIPSLKDTLTKWVYLRMIFGNAYSERRQRRCGWKWIITNLRDTTCGHLHVWALLSTVLQCTWTWKRW